MFIRKRQWQKKELLYRRIKMLRSYVKAQRDGNKLYIGDHVGQDENAQTVRGKVGEGPDAAVSPEEAQKLAGQAALRLLSTISHYCDGDLDKVDQVIKVVGIVNGTSDFIGHGKVINGASDMFVEVLGDRVNMLAHAQALALCLQLSLWSALCV